MNSSCAGCMQLPAVWMTCRTVPNNDPRRTIYSRASAIIYSGKRFGLLHYLFFQRITAKRVGEVEERFESFDDGLVVNCSRFGILNHNGGRRGWWRGWWRRYRSNLGRVGNPSPLFLNICDILNPGCNSFQSVMDRRLNFETRKQ